jgi:hypothetical protein
MTVIIGVDPHKAPHTAVAVNNEELELARKRESAIRSSSQRALNGHPAKLTHYPNWAAPRQTTKAFSPP